jgi:hypothetical protein
MARKNATPMEAAKKMAEKGKSTRKAKLSDSSSSDELEKTNGSSSDDEIAQRKRQRRPLFLNSAQRR